MARLSFMTEVRKEIVMKKHLLSAIGVLILGASVAFAAPQESHSRANPQPFRQGQGGQWSYSAQGPQRGYGQRWTDVQQQNPRSGRYGYGVQQQRYSMRNQSRRNDHYSSRDRRDSGYSRHHQESRRYKGRR